MGGREGCSGGWEGTRRRAEEDDVDYGDASNEREEGEDEGGESGGWWDGFETRGPRRFALFRSSFDVLLLLR